MRMISGAILLLAGEQAFTHAHSIGFPHTTFARSVLFPASYVLVGLGVLLLVWGVLTERTSSPSKE